MSDPSNSPDGGSISEATGRTVRADRARVVAAEQAARRRRGSLAGRLDRVWRWLRNRQTGPLPRLRRVGSMVRTTIRDRGPWRQLPEGLATAFLAPVRVPGQPQAPRPPADRAREREAAAERLAGFARRSLDARPRVAVIADTPALLAYREAWDVIAVRPEDWRSTLAAPPELLVVDSARSGNGGAWSYRIAWTAHPDWFLLHDLRALTRWCAEHATPTILRIRDGAAEIAAWADAAALFDLVLVHDEAMAAAVAALADRRGGIQRLPLPAAPGESDAVRLLGAVRAAA